MDCPGQNTNCREDLKKCIVTAANELKDKVETKVAKKTIFWLAGTCVTVSCLFIGGLIAAESKQNQNIAKIEVIQNDIAHIKKSQEETKEVFSDAIKEQKKEAKETLKSILKAIEELRKEN